MRFGKIAAKAKQAVDRRGGVGALKGDAAELREIAKGEGSLKDKAKAASEAVKRPGRAEGASSGAPAREQEPAAQSPPGTADQGARRE